MTSERQIAANRRNASKSSGPNSSAGKRRAARNSLKHGLAASTTADTYLNPEIDKLANKIAGKMDDVSIRECARVIAAAELELDHIRRIRVGLIENAGLFDLDDEQQEQGSLEEEASAKGAASVTTRSLLPWTTEQSVDALRRALRIVRYERCAVKKRDEAVRRVLQLRAFQ